MDAAAERLQSADAVAAVKWLTKATIEDPVRAEQVLQWQLLVSPDCATEREEAVAEVAGARQLDALYRQALGFATRSYCPP